MKSGRGVKAAQDEPQPHACAARRKFSALTRLAMSDQLRDDVRAALAMSDAELAEAQQAQQLAEASTSLDADTLAALAISETDVWHQTVDVADANALQELAADYKSGARADLSWRSSTICAGCTSGCTACAATATASPLWVRWIPWLPSLPDARAQAVWRTRVPDVCAACRGVPAWRRAEFDELGKHCVRATRPRCSRAAAAPTASGGCSRRRATRASARLLQWLRLVVGAHAPAARAVAAHRGSCRRFLRLGGGGDGRRGRRAAGAGSGERARAARPRQCLNAQSVPWSERCGRTGTSSAARRPTARPRAGRCSPRASLPSRPLRRAAPHRLERGGARRRRRRQPSLSRRCRRNSTPLLSARRAQSSGWSLASSAPPPSARGPAARAADAPPTTRRRRRQRRRRAMAARRLCARRSRVRLRALRRKCPRAGGAPTAPRRRRRRARSRCAGAARLQAARVLRADVPPPRCGLRAAARAAVARAPHRPSRIRPPAACCPPACPAMSALIEIDVITGSTPSRARRRRLQGTTCCPRGGTGGGDAAAPPPIVVPQERDGQVEMLVREYKVTAAAAERNRCGAAPPRLPRAGQVAGIEAVELLFQPSELEWRPTNDFSCDVCRRGFSSRHRRRAPGAPERPPARATTPTARTTSSFATSRPHRFQRCQGGVLRAVAAAGSGLRGFYLGLSLYRHVPLLRRPPHARRSGAAPRPSTTTRSRRCRLLVL